MPKKQAKKLHPVTQYAADVISGKIPACKWVRLACKRHFDDDPEKYCSIDKCNKRGLWFDCIDRPERLDKNGKVIVKARDSAATNIIRFFEEFLVFYEGAFDGQPFILTPHEKFIVGSIFGWKKKNGFRQIGRAHV